MDNIVNIILNKKNENENKEDENKEDENKFISNITLIMQNFIDSYNTLKQLDYYTSKIVKIKSGTPNILIIRETLYSLLIKHSNLTVKKKNNTYYIKKVDDDVSLNLLLAYSIFFFLDNIHSLKKLSIGFDFEFNENKIALCQVGFFPKRKNKYIFVFDPKTLNDYQRELVIKTMFTSNITKITHGSDSLDIPYIFQELFMGDSEKILRFTENMLDTRFLCEYVKIYSSSQDKKCSIYDALLYFKVISKKKYDELMKNNEIMGPIQDVKWNIKKMSSYHLKYAMYDVFYLKKFISKIYSTATMKNVALRNQLDIISTINRFVCFERFELSHILIISKKMTDDINNYIAESSDKSKRNTLITIYSTIIDKIMIPSLELKVTKLLEINNFKKALVTLFKRIVYSIITHKYTVYKNKTYRYDNKITWKEITNELLNLKLDKLVLLLEKFYDSAKSMISIMM